MNATATNSSPGTITPAVHLEFIQNHVEHGQPSGLEQTEHYHRAIFLHHHALEWEKYRQESQTHQDRLAFLEARLKQTQLELGERTKLVPVSLEGREDREPNLPWNAWDRAMFFVGALGIVGLVTFGVLNISFNLLESGLITFQANPIRSYLWAALLPVGALTVKIGWDSLSDRRQRDIYLWTCMGLGMLGVLVWLAAYACVYPTLSKGINEHIAALTVFDNPSAPASAPLNFAGAKWVDVVTVAGQALAEIFLSAVIGIYLTTLYARHRPVRLAQDPTFRQLDQERLRLEESVARERRGLGEATGNLMRLENQLAALVAYSRSMFHREAARRQNQSEKKQVILDQLSEQLRHHLEANEPGGRLTGVPRAPAAGNGGP